MSASSLPRFHISVKRAESVRLEAEFGHPTRLAKEVGSPRLLLDLQEV